MHRKWALRAAVLLIVMMMAACGGNSDGTTGETGNGTGTGNDATTGGTNAGGTDGEVQTADAEAIYKQNCVSCHGTDLKGVMGGKTNLTQVGARLSRDEIAQTINNGRSSGMPAFQNRLSEEEVAALADWLSTKK
jgi:cytochrome c551